jgi:hypothetical protein
VRTEFMGKDPASITGDSPTIYRTDRADRTTLLVQGWRVTDPQALADIGGVPEHEEVVEVPIEVLRYAARHEGWEER